MFTGIVEEKGQVKSINKNKSSLTLIIEATTVTSDVSIGDSIAVNGVCLTVTSFGNNWFSVDVIPETFRGSSLATIKIGSQINLERAMSASGRFGGHFVSGHVDTVGEIKRTWTEDNALYIYIKLSDEGLHYVTLKGSICVDGTSLTVFGVKEDGFIISLIPETQRATVLGEKRQGDIVNVEYDMLAKYMERLISAKKENKSTRDESITMEKLQQYGF
ncbi:riboflavin synthase [Aquibacillus halophilus]|uniref:Riboflavin synthase n=1 Tax=Aquibacillus halophilus TaxID=930132 RepID=A0A6A8DDD2_9BACI|nr:riboflavin synthase [Aquibacillus halophilus]